MQNPAQQIAAPEEIFEERRTSRKGFLRKAGVTLAIGLGGALALARPAWAQNGHCCRDPNCNNPPCSDVNSRYNCTDCDGTTCCACHNFGPQCISLGCGLC
jgi:hypothetical protein